MVTTITRSTDAASIIPSLVLDGWQSEDEPQTIVHPILGSERVDITLRPARARTGTLRLLFWDAAAAEAARVFHRAPALFYTFSDMVWLPAVYVPNGPVRPAQRAENLKRWVLEVPFQEVLS